MYVFSLHSSSRHLELVIIEKHYTIHPTFELCSQLDDFSSHRPWILVPHYPALCSSYTALTNKLVIQTGRNKAFCSLALLEVRLLCSPILHYLKLKWKCLDLRGSVVEDLDCCFSVGLSVDWVLPPKMSCFGGGASDELLKEQSRRNKAIDQQLKKDKDVYKSTHRLLLLGECLRTWGREGGRGHTDQLG